MQDIHDVVHAATHGPMSGVLEYSNAPIVSSDVIVNPHSSIYDSEFTTVSDGRFVKTLNWYDDEWGCANRLCDIVQG